MLITDHPTDSAMEARVSRAKGRGESDMSQQNPLVFLHAYPGGFYRLIHNASLAPEMVGPQRERERKKNYARFGP